MVRMLLESGDKLYSSITVCFCALRKYVFHIGLKQEPNVDYLSINYHPGKQLFQVAGAGIEPQTL